MSTQAVVSLVDDGHTLVKAVCGCNGSNAPKLADAIREQGLTQAREIYLAAQNMYFGCADCLVVLANGGDIVYHDGLSELDPLYRETFTQSTFNPRWRNGTADYTETVQLCHVA